MTARDATQKEPRRAIVAACRRLAEKGLMPGSAGNVSCRIAGGMLITPSGARAEALRPEDLVALDLAGGGAPSGLRPSSEWRLHASIYRRTPEAQAVVHAHADHATALACCRRPLPAFHYLVAAFGGAEVPCLPYAPFGTVALAEAAAAALERHTACLLANHGMVCRGPSLDRAVANALLLEDLARQYLLSLPAGGPALLDATEMARMAERMRDYFG